MRAFVIFIFIFIFTSFNLVAGAYSIPQKLRGRYKCEVPSYEINHKGVITKVEALSAILLVYKTKIILKIGERSFPANVDRKVASRRNPIYEADFPLPLNTCMVTFDRKENTIRVENQLFKDALFQRIR